VGLARSVTLASRGNQLAENWQVRSPWPLRRRPPSIHRTSSPATVSGLVKQKELGVGDRADLPVVATISVGLLGDNRTPLHANNFFGQQHKGQGWRREWDSSSFAAAPLWRDLITSTTPSRRSARREEVQRGASEGRWRREWDSNPRYSFPYTRFPSVPDRPLQHLSGFRINYLREVGASQQGDCALTRVRISTF
jgi:hypothetical protein